MVNSIIDAEIVKYLERVATKSLVNNYIKKLNALRGSLLEEFTTAFNGMEGLRTAIRESESVYAAYDAKAKEVKDYLDKNPSGYCHLPVALFELARNAKDKM